MLHPVIPYTVSGFLWYQGEANATNEKDTAQYGFTLPGFAAEIQSRFEQGDLPWLAVQLPSFNNSNWPWFRESQNRVTEAGNAYVAVTIDSGSLNNIHPNDKAIVGTRLSLLARKYVHGEAIEAHGPLFDSITMSGDQMTVAFTHADGLYTDDGQPPASFELAGVDQQWYSATSALISGTNVILSSTSVASPVAVRYAWKPYPKDEINLTNTAGLPTAPFRTDSWPMPGLGAQTPQSVGDAYNARKNGSLVVPPSGILGNDIDLNHDALTASTLADVSHGTLGLNSDGSFTYTPDTGFLGTDSFTYRCSDGRLASPEATVEITVLDGYAGWKSTIVWTPGDEDTPYANPDQDGFVNFLEYAYDLDPLSFDSTGGPTFTLNGSNFDYNFRNLQEGVVYKVKRSTNLVTWTLFSELTDQDATPVLIPTTEKTLFIRLMVEDTGSGNFTE